MVNCVKGLSVSKITKQTYLYHGMVRDFRL